MSQLSPSDQQNLRIIVEGFFGKANTAHWEMNEELLKVVTQMLQADKSCSNAMDFVPRPGVYISPKDVLKELSRIAKRVLSGDKSYEICKKAVANKWRTAAEIAAQGV
jgi:hypothetical protein